MAHTLSLCTFFTVTSYFLQKETCLDDMANAQGEAEGSAAIHTGIKHRAVAVQLARVVHLQPVAQNTSTTKQNIQDKRRRRKTIERKKSEITRGHVLVSTLALDTARFWPVCHPDSQLRVCRQV